MVYEVFFYEKDNGEIPVLKFLESLPVKLRAKTFREIELLKELGPVLREPHVKSLKGHANRGLFELRAKFGTDITRVFYFSFDGTSYILLHGFVKKTMTTPKRELEIARKYKQDHERRFKNE